MSEDPVRMLSKNGLGAEERAILRAGLDVDPPVGAKDEVWAGLAARLPPGGGAGGGGSGAIDAVQGAVWKKLAIGFAMGLAGMGGAELASHYGDTTRPTAGVTAQPIVAAEAPRGDMPAPPPSPIEARRPPVATTPQVAPASTAQDPLPASSVAAFPDAPPVDPATQRKSQLQDESRMLRQARSALQSGNPGGALAILGELKQQHPNLILAQEHEALSIDALLASGGKSAAKERAQRFLQSYPTSPHAEKMRTIAGQ